MRTHSSFFFRSGTLFLFFALFPNAICLQKHPICMENAWIYWEGMINMCPSLRSHPLTDSVCISSSPYLTHMLLSSFLLNFE